MRKLAKFIEILDFQKHMEPHYSGVLNTFVRHYKKKVI